MPVFHLPHIPVKHDERHELEKLNEGLLFAGDLIDPSKIEVLELFETVQMRLADLRANKDK